MRSNRLRHALAVLAFAAGASFVYRDLFAGRVFAGRDIYRLFIPNAHFLLECLRELELPLWIPYERLGQPFAAVPYTQAFYPAHLLVLLASGPVWAHSVGQVLHAFIAAAGTFLLCRRLRASFVASALGAAAFSLSHFFTAMVWIPNVADAAAWSGFLLAAAHAVATRRGPKTAALLAIPVAMALLCGSPETVLWQGMLAVGAAVVWSTQRLRAAATCVAGLALGAAIAGVVLIPGLELARHSTRLVGQESPLEWSMSPAQIASLALPLADQPLGPYWGGPDQHYLESAFMGALVCALAVAGVRLCRRVMPLAVGAAFFLLLSLGAHFPPARWVLTLPPFEWFRYPAKYVVGACFCIAVLSALGLDRITALAREVRGSAVCVGIVLAGALMVMGIGTALVKPPTFRVGTQLGMYWSSLAVAAGALAFFAVLNPRMRALRVRVNLVALVLVELALSHALLGRPVSVEAEALTHPSKLAAAIPRPFAGRISIDVPHEVKAKDIVIEEYIARSRDALIPMRWVEERLMALEGYGDPKPFRHWRLDGHRSVFDLVGVEYYVRAGPAPFDDLELVADASTTRLYRSRTAMPRAFVVHRAVVADDDEALAALEDPSQPARRTAFLAAGDPLLGADCSSTAELADRGPNRVEVMVEACADGYLIVSDAFFPGWAATLDGNDVPLMRANFLMRAVRVPKGRHRVDMEYWPWTFRAGGVVSVIGLLALAMLLAPDWHRASR